MIAVTATFSLLLRTVSGALATLLGAATGLIVTSPSPKTMDPTEDDSVADVILRIRSEHADDIEEGTKNHEYRTYLLREQVKTVWLWDDGLEAIKLIITITAPKRPGEVNDPTGKGNDDFDNGLKVSKYGYPILAVYRLPALLTRGMLQEEYGIDMEEGRQYVKQKLADAFPIATLVRVLPKAKE